VNDVEQVVGRCGVEGEEKQTTINQIRWGGQFAKVVACLVFNSFVEIIII
jgi:hypothetical protein